MNLKTRKKETELNHRMLFYQRLFIRLRTLAVRFCAAGVGDPLQLPFHGQCAPSVALVKDLLDECRGFEVF